MRSPALSQSFLSTSKFLNTIEQVREHEEYLPLFENHPRFGSAYYNTTGLLETGNRRFFTKVKYRLPRDTEDRFQAFYMSSGTNTSDIGRNVLFPCDGEVIRYTFSSSPTPGPRKKEFSTWIAKLDHTQSSLSVVASTTKKKEKRKQETSIPLAKAVQGVKGGEEAFAKRFGTPYFIVLSYCMRHASLHPHPGQLWQLGSEAVESLLSILQSPFSWKEVQENAMTMLAPQILRMQYVKLGVHKNHVDVGTIINRFIGNAISFNFLRSLPSSLSTFADEYPGRSRYELDYNHILDGNVYRLSFRTSSMRTLVAGEYRLSVPLSDGFQYVPYESLSMDLELDGYNMRNFLELYFRHRDVIQQMKSSIQSFRRDEAEEMMTTTIKNNPASPSSLPPPVITAPPIMMTIDTRTINETKKKNKKQEEKKSSSSTTSSPKTMTVAASPRYSLRSRSRYRS